MPISSSLKKDIIQWDVSSWSVALEYWEQQIADKPLQTGLELGARNGGLSLWLALKGMTVVCSDIENPQLHAEKLHQQYNVRDKIIYQKVDATNIPYSNYFDVIAIKSILGSIGRNNRPDLQKKTIEQIHKALKPGGYFLFAENLKASFLHQWARQKFVKWGKEWRYIGIQEMNSLLKNFSSYEIKTNGVIAVFGRTEAQRQILSKIDKLLLNHICPDGWKYIAYGIAVK